MGQRLSIVFTTITIAFFLILAVIFVLTLNSERKDNVAVANETMQLARDKLHAAYVDPNTTRQQLRDVIRGIISSNSRMDTIAVYSYTSGVDYLWARDRSYVANNAQNIAKIAGLPQFRLNNLSQVQITDSFDGSGTSTYFVSAMFTVVANSDVFPLLRYCLVLVLLFALGMLLITVLLMVTSLRAEGAARLQNADRPVEAEQKTPSHSGSSNREQLEHRLTLELERAAYNEQDLTVVQIRFPGLSKKPELSPQFAALVLSHFAFEDLIFALDDESYFVIMVNTDLAGGMKSAEHFQVKCADTAIKCGLEHPVIGLSSRNGRLTDSRQILKEARQAVQKANNDAPPRIVGFHPDPQKYRDFLSTRNVATTKGVQQDG